MKKNLILTITGIVLCIAMFFLTGCTRNNTVMAQKDNNFVILATTTHDNITICTLREKVTNHMYILTYSINILSIDALSLIPMYNGSSVMTYQAYNAFMEMNGDNQ